LLEDLIFSLLIIYHFTVYLLLDFQTFMVHSLNNYPNANFIQEKLNHAITPSDENYQMKELINLKFLFYF